MEGKVGEEREKFGERGRDTKRKGRGSMGGKRNFQRASERGWNRHTVRVERHDGKQRGGVIEKETLPEIPRKCINNFPRNPTIAE